MSGVLDGYLMMPDREHRMHDCVCEGVIEVIPSKSFLVKRYLLIHEALRSGMSRQLVEGVL